jgi:hypothetical protein
MREEAIVEIYRRRLKSSSEIKFVTSTRILKPLADRAYFHLVYGTNHWKGLYEFRAVEQKLVREQERVRDIARYNFDFDQTGQTGLFGPGEISGVSFSFEEQRSMACTRALKTLRGIIETSTPINYENIWAILLEEPLVWANDINGWIVGMQKAGIIKIEGMGSRERTPKRGHVIVRLT